MKTYNPQKRDMSTRWLRFRQVIKSLVAWQGIMLLVGVLR